MKIKKVTFSKAEKIADQALSKLVRTQRTYCEFHTGPSGIGFVNPPCRCSGPLQLCHKITRKKKSTRYDRRNVFSGCSGSNLWSHYNQLEWDKLWRKMWPEDVEYLDLASRVMVKRSAEDLLQMAAYFDRKRQ